MEEKKTRRNFTPEQNYEILQALRTFRTIKEGLMKYQLHNSVYRKWQRQLSVGIRASLRNSKPLKAPDLKKLEAENRKLKEIVPNQSLIISELKKGMHWD